MNHTCKTLLLLLLGLSLIPTSLGRRMKLLATGIRALNPSACFKYPGASTEPGNARLRCFVRRRLAGMQPELDARAVEDLSCRLEDIAGTHKDSEDIQKFNRLLHKGLDLLSYELGTLSVDQIDWERLRHRLNVPDSALKSEFADLYQKIKSNHPMTVLQQEGQHLGIGSTDDSHLQIVRDRLHHYAHAAEWHATRPYRNRDIAWCRKQWQGYFLEGGAAKIALKRAKCAYYAQHGCRMSTEEQDHFLSMFNHSFGKDWIQKVRLLDVGSCVNSFNFCDELQTTAIDLLPMRSDVLRCDVLHLQIGPCGSPPLFSNDGKYQELLDGTSESQSGIGSGSMLVQLPAAGFDVAVIMCMLSRLPSVEQRTYTIEKVKKLLDVVGLLLLVEPAKWPVMESCRILESCGFVRWGALTRIDRSLAVAYAKVPEVPWSQAIHQDEKCPPTT